MKKIFYLASIAALALSSCAKDETTEAQINALNGGSKITAAMSADDTRTSLDANRNVSWSAGDQLGVYTVGGGLSNAAFVLDNASDGQAIGVFASQSAELTAGGKYLAVYPRFQEALFETVADKEYTHPTDATKDPIKMADYQNVNVKIPAVQKYQNGSFYTQTVPAVSTAFTVDTDGEAKVSMQPVVDYLFVNIQSVEPIYELQLQLFDGTKSGDNRYQLNGTTSLQSYVYNGEYRHYADFDEGTLSKTAPEATITLEIDEASAKVMCHSANTYVFTVPANILGKGIAANTRAVLTINPDEGNVKKIAFTNNSNNIGKTVGDVTYVKNNTLNYTVKAGKQDTSDANRNYRQLNAATDYADDQLLPLENTIFWMNDLDANGDRTAFTYNPANTYIIEHEGQLLKYLTEYGTANFNGKADGKVDALICSEHTFNFTKDHIKAMSDLKDAQNNSVYAEFEQYFAAYIAGNFPCIANYSNSFRGMEYNGEVPVITGIENRLSSPNGIFGNISGKIENVIFSDVYSAYTDYYQDDSTPRYIFGTILGSLDGGKLDNVTVKNANGLAIVDKLDVDNYNELTIENAAGLQFIALNMDLTKGIEIKNWDVVSAVANNVFGTLDAVTDTDGDSHHVVKLPATADYAKLAMYTGTVTDVATIETSEVTNFGKIVAGDTRANLKPIPAVQTDLNVVSVLVGETSVWTGDKFPLSYASNAKLLPAQFKSNDANYPSYFKLEYAEQLATGATKALKALVMRDMDLTYAPNRWAMTTVGTLDGGNHTVKGVAMKGAVVTASFDNSAIAPVDADIIKNLTVDGVSIDIYTDQDEVVPNYIGGLAVNAIDVQNVKVKGLTITGDGVNKNNEQYADDNGVYIGWLTAKSTNPWIIGSTVEVVENQIGGIAGLVGYISLNGTTTTHAGARIQNSAATVTTTVQTSMEGITEVGNTFEWGKANIAGTVGYVKNNMQKVVSITFDSEPTFKFYAPAGINVLYNGGVGNYKSSSYEVE